MGNITAELFSKEWPNSKYKVAITQRLKYTDSRLHMHDYFEIEIIVGGEGGQILNGDYYPLKRGSAYLLSPIDFHKLIIPKKLEILNICFDSNMVSNQIVNSLINRNSSIIFEMNDDDISQAEFIASLISKDYTTDDSYSAINTKNLLETLLVFILRHTDLCYAENRSIDPIHKCMRYLFLHFNETPSLDDMAKLSGYSTSYFSKQFHEVTGKKYIEFLTDLRLNHAKMLLISTKKNIIEISDECGFNSLSRFNHAFKEAVGISPTQYRQTLRN